MEPIGAVGIEGLGFRVGLRIHGEGVSQGCLSDLSGFGLIVIQRVYGC